MVQTNKILTVSYGTFSCTLEGFDDAFGTMKAIAEYFRDLAADDRYFGAEPPQPDAEMLARIAQKEISRRVDAHADATGILLRATAPALSAASPAAETAAAPQPAPAAETSPEAPAETPAVAAEPAPVAEPAAPAEPVAAEPTPEPAQVAPAAESVAPQSAEIEPETVEAEDMPAPVMAPMADTLADKLARIRAVVDRNEAASNEAVAEEQTQSWDQAPVGEEQPQSWEQAPVAEEQAQSWEQTPVAEEQPQSWEQAPVAEEQTQTWEQTPVAEEQTQSWEQAPVAEEQSQSWEQAPTAQELGTDLPDEAADLAQTPQEENFLDATAEAIDPDEATLDAVSAALTTDETAADAPEFPAADSDDLVTDTALADPVTGFDETILETPVHEQDAYAQDADEQGSDFASDVLENTPLDVSGFHATDDQSDADVAADDTGWDTTEDLTSESLDLDAPYDAEDADQPAPSAEISDLPPLTLTPDLAAGETAEGEDDEMLDDAVAEDRPDWEVPPGTNIPQDFLDEVVSDYDSAFSEEEKARRDDTAEAAPFVAENPIVDAGPELDAPEGDTMQDAPAEEDEANVFSSIDWDADDEDDDQADDVTIQNILSELGPRNEAAVQAAASGPVTRVIKVKRAEIDTAIEAGALEEVAAETPKSSLSDADEADLQAELDAVAAELAEAQAALNPPDEDAAPATGERHRGSEVIETTRPDVNRLMAKADSQMDDPVSSSRRAAYSHLRAAVAAAEAEESLGTEMGAPAHDDAAYREDLASVVRPRRPELAAGADRPARPGAGERPAPLKLVAEQRVDADLILPQRGPIRPRRIAQQEAEAAGDASGGFAAFANEVGARELHELLEAAAAYMSFVEGWEQFSRPQLMTRVKQVSTSGFNREDGLRTFGQLLREGKIEKTSGGRFTASEQINYRPAHSVAG